MAPSNLRSTHLLLIDADYAADADATDDTVTADADDNAANYTADAVAAYTTDEQMSRC